MKKSFIYLFAAASVAMVSCTEVETDNGQIVTFKAGEINTKVTLVDNVKIRWVANDKVSIFDDENTNKQFVATTADNGISATLKGQGKFAGVEISANTATNNMSFNKTYYAVYPYQSSTTLTDGVFSFSANSNNVLSGNQFAVDGNFANGKGANNAKGVYVAKSDNGFFEFKPATAFIKFTISQSDIKKIRFNNNSGSPRICGPFLVDYTGSTPVVSIDEAKNTNGNEIVFANVSDFSTAIAPGTYMISVLPAVFNKETSGTTIQMKILIHTDNTANGKHVKQINMTKHFTLNPGDVLNIGEIGHD